MGKGAQDKVWRDTREAQKTKRMNRNVCLKGFGEQTLGIPRVLRYKRLQGFLAVELSYKVQCWLMEPEDITFSICTRFPLEGRGHKCNFTIFSPKMFLFKRKTERKKWKRW